MDNVTDNQEVVGKSLLRDNAELQVQPILQLGRDDRIAPVSSFERELPELVECPRPVGNAWRHRAISHGYDIGAPLGDLFGCPQRLGTVGKVAGQLAGRAEPGSL